MRAWLTFDNQEQSLLAAASLVETAASMLSNHECTPAGDLQNQRPEVLMTSYQEID